MTAMAYKAVYLLGMYRAHRQLHQILLTYAIQFYHPSEIIRSRPEMR